MRGSQQVAKLERCPVQSSWFYWFPEKPILLEIERHSCPSHQLLREFLAGDGGNGSGTVPFRQ